MSASWTHQYWCHMMNQGHDLCRVRIHDPEVVRQTSYPLGQRYCCRNFSHLTFNLPNFLNVNVCICYESNKIQRETVNVAFTDKLDMFHWNKCLAWYCKGNPDANNATADESNPFMSLHKNDYSLTKERNKQTKKQKKNKNTM